MARYLFSMCYSAMVLQDARQLGLRFDARVQLDMYEDLFSRRGAGEKLSINKAMEIPFLQAPQSPQEFRISQMITDWRLSEISRCEVEMFSQKKRLANAEKTLKEKETKKAIEDLRISSKKITEIKNKISKLQTDTVKSTSETSVFPFGFLSMIYVNQQGEKGIAPFRYHLRPNGQPESFDRKYNGCYNARKDNLGNPFWKPVFGKNHGLMVVHKFYEHVLANDYRVKDSSQITAVEGKKNLVLEFQPTGSEIMLIPTLWDLNQQKDKADLFSCALITDHPPPEIAETGHNRCPIFLKEENLEAWLNPKGKSLQELHKILSDKHQVFYQHQIVSAA